MLYVYNVSDISYGRYRTCNKKISKDTLCGKEKSSYFVLSQKALFFIAHKCLKNRTDVLWIPSGAQTFRD